MGDKCRIIQHKKAAGEKDTGLVSLKHLGGRLATYRSQGLLDRAWCIFLRLATYKSYGPVGLGASWGCMLATYESKGVGQASAVQ